MTRLFEYIDVVFEEGDVAMWLEESGSGDQHVAMEPLEFDDEQRVIERLDRYAAHLATQLTASQAEVKRLREELRGCRENGEALNTAAGIWEEEASRQAAGWARLSKAASLLCKSAHTRSFGFRTRTVATTVSPSALAKLRAALEAPK